MKRLPAILSALLLLLSPGLAPPISNLALVRIQMKPRGIAPATSRAARAAVQGGAETGTGCR